MKCIKYSGGINNLTISSSILLDGRFINIYFGVDGNCYQLSFDNSDIAESILNDIWIFLEDKESTVFDIDLQLAEMEVTK
jgi:hypothetical protein